MMRRKGKWLPVALHIAAWVIFFSIPHFMRPEPVHRDSAPIVLPKYSSTFWLGFSFLQNLLLVPLFYFNTFYILPRLLPAKRYLLLFLIQLVALLVQFSYVAELTALLLPELPHKPGKLMPLLVYLITLSVAFGYYFFNESLRIEQLQKDKENEALKSELQFLRWQISPHFLFNALNNMVALARRKSDKLEPMIINLSGIMRYMLYETDEARVTLQKEAQYLDNFIRLQSLRYDDITIEEDIKVPDQPLHFIEPMLLIPFVENAFKHGIDLIESPVIKIRLSIVANELHFYVANKYLPGNNALRDDAHGVGLANVEKRLNLLYDGRHTLQTEINGWYIVSLKIQLN